MQRPVFSVADSDPGLVSTERLRLEPVRPAHADDLVLLHSGPDVALWYGGTWTKAEARAWAAQMQHRWQHQGVGKWMAYRLTDGELIGRGGLSWTELSGEQRLELGWAIREQHRGHGYATEIGRAGLAFAFETLAAEEVVAFTEVHNHASRAVMARLGMTQLGQLYRPGLLEGRTGIHNAAPFALYRINRNQSSVRTKLS
jgi:RimJ/RimL family protein N-acetyltransferase